MRLIDADAVNLNDIPCSYAGNCDIDDVQCWLDEQPTVDAEPVRHGEWRHLGGDEWCCTICGEVIHTEGSWEKPTRKYCHDCGAKMDGGKA